MLNFRTAIAVRHLLTGDVVACATEGVWGLSCNPFDAEAVAKLLQLKSRSVDKGLILVAAAIEQLSFLLEPLTSTQKAQLQLSWPGPTTWLVPHNNRVPHWISGEHDTVAVRVSDHPAVKELCMAWGGPVVSTSANRSGAQAATEIHQVIRYFGDELGCVMAGRPGNRKGPSRIVDLQSGVTLRPG